MLAGHLVSPRSRLTLSNIHTCLFVHHFDKRIKLVVSEEVLYNDQKTVKLLNINTAYDLPLY